MKAKECMYGWNPGTDQVIVVSWPDSKMLTAKYQMTNGACNSCIHDMNESQLTRYTFIEAIDLIVRDKVDPMAVHKAFYQIDEYRLGLSLDFPAPK